MVFHTDDSRKPYEKLPFDASLFPPLFLLDSSGRSLRTLASELF